MVWEVREGFFEEVMIELVLKRGGEGRMFLGRDCVKVWGGREESLFRELRDVRCGWSKER